VVVPLFMGVWGRESLGIQRVFSLAHLPPKQESIPASQSDSSINHRKYVLYANLRARDISVGGDVFGFSEGVNRAYVIR
jgi:hypothetical protein